MSKRIKAAAKAVKGRSSQAPERSTTDAKAVDDESFDDVIAHDELWQYMQHHVMNQRQAA